MIEKFQHSIKNEELKSELKEIAKRVLLNLEILKRNMLQKKQKKINKHQKKLTKKSKGNGRY